MLLHNKVLPNQTHSLVRDISKPQEEELGKTRTSHLEVLLLKIRSYCKLTAKNAHSNSFQRDTETQKTEVCSQ